MRGGQENEGALTHIQIRLGYTIRFSLILNVTLSDVWLVSPSLGVPE